MLQWRTSPYRVSDVIDIAVESWRYDRRIDVDVTSVTYFPFYDVGLVDGERH